MHKFLVATIVLFLITSGCTTPQSTCGNQICESLENAENCPEDCIVELSENEKIISNLLKGTLGSEESENETALNLSIKDRISLKKLARALEIPSEQLCFSPGNIEELRLSIEKVIELRGKKELEATVKIVCEKSAGKLRLNMRDKSETNPEFAPGKLVKCNCTQGKCCAIVFSSEKTQEKKTGTEKENADTTDLNASEENSEDQKADNDLSIESIELIDFHLGHDFTLRIKIRNSIIEKDLNKPLIFYEVESENSDCHEYEESLDLNDEEITLEKKISCRESSPGIHKFKVSVEEEFSDSNAENNSLEAEISVPETQYPDLIVNRLDAESASGLMVGKPYTIKIGIKNKGKASFVSATGLEVKLKTVIKTVPLYSLEPGEESRIFSIPAGQGTEIEPFMHINTAISGKADPNNNVKEEDELNNYLTSPLTISQNPGNYCYDADDVNGGKEIQENSRCMDKKSQWHQDSCDSAYALNEFECVDNKCSQTAVSCLDLGFTGCLAGACIEEPLCEDTDGGIEAGIAGECLQGGRKWKTDRCEENTLKEAYCFEGRCASKEIPCAKQGYAECNAGACTD